MEIKMKIIDNEQLNRKIEEQILESNWKDFLDDNYNEELKIYCTR